jgi:hypothetical protein
MMPKRTVEGNLITSDAQPAIRMRIDPALIYAGMVSMVLGGTAQAESFQFVAADAHRRIMRHLTVQFEHFLDSAPDKHYNYSTDRTETFAGVEYQTDLRVVPARLFHEQPLDPESDMAQIATLLTGQGYTMPYHQEYVVFKRMVRLLGHARRAELLLVYTEALPTVPVETREEHKYLVSTNDAGKLAAFEQRARDSFSVPG